MSDWRWVQWLIYAAAGIYAVVSITVTVVKEWRKVAAVRAQCARDIAEAEAQAARAIEEAKR